VLLLIPNAEGLRVAKRWFFDAAATTPKADGQPHRGLEGTGNRRLHVALLGALAAAALIALAVPITRTRASTSETSPPQAAASEGIMTAVRAQAGAVTALVSSSSSTSSNPATLSTALNSVPGGALVPKSLLAAVGQVATGTTVSPDPGSMVVLGAPRGPISFTLHEEGFSAKQTSKENTVGQALATLGIRLSSRDLVEPPAESRLENGMHVFVTHAKSVRLIAGARESIVYTRAETVAGFLAELGIAVEPTDHVFPALDDPVKRGMSISVVTFRDGLEFTEDPLVYETEIEYDSAMLQGEREIVQYGVDGYVRRQYQIKQLNGQELDRVLVNEEWVWPTNEVIAVGTRVPATPPPPTRPPVVSAPTVSFEGMSCVSSLNVYATWYTAASSGGSGTTATGTGVYKGIVAVDPNVIPLGTKMYIPGYGYGLAADTGGAIKGNIIDLGYGPNDVYDWRSRYLDICILG
jgi:3D (Asp-Asp-Asp) domain-containing protein